MAGAPAPRHLRSLGVVLAVAAVHLLGLWAWLAVAGRPWHLGPLRTSTPISVWLMELAAPAETAEPPTGQARQRSLPDRATVATEPSPANTTSNATTATQPSAEPALQPAPLPDGAPTAPAPSTQPRPALNLALPRGAAATLAAPSLAARTPFHGRLPATVERQLETAAGESGPWIEERLDYDHIRYRRGNTCVTMERPAASRIDPGNDALQRLPWLANVSRCP